MTRRFSSCAAVLLPVLLLPGTIAHARNLMTADGPGGTATYPLLQQAYTTELPDCGHMVPHITEAFDDELKNNVFVFHAHVGQDDDRCGATDRQRTEIRGRAADIVADNGATVHYRWKFKLDAKFQSTTSFTHIFQIKSDQAAPVMTLTPRTSTMAIDGRIGARGTTPLAKFLGVWVVVDLTVKFGNAGSVAMTIKPVAGGETLFSYQGAADTWDDGASAHDPKFGIYRSLNNRGDLRDEQVRFADFCVSKQSASECDDGATPPSDAGADSGGEADAGGGGDAGAGGAGGISGTGGAGGSGGGAGQGGQGGMAGMAGMAGTAGTGGRGGTGGAPAPKPDAGPTPQDPPSGGGSGCSCNLGPAGGATGVAGLPLLAGALGLWLRRRRRR